MSSDREARFDRIMAADGAALRRLAMTYGQTPADADDLFQEICFALWRALPSFRGESSERTFAFRIGHNRGLTFRARRRPAAAEIDDQLRDDSPGPVSLATAALSRERLLDAVRRLAEGHRQVVILSLEGLPHAEIAQILGITENNVAVRLSRARTELRALLAEKGAEA
jgi:RNA polymerase sigma factor (sigma-70 family)